MINLIPVTPLPVARAATRSPSWLRQPTTEQDSGNFDELIPTDKYSNLNPLQQVRGRERSIDGTAQRRDRPVSAV